jgi:hypothetical protein
MFTQRIALSTRTTFHVLTCLVMLSIYLVLPTAPAQAAITCQKYHTVAQGETLDKIAREYGVSATELASVNGITDGALTVGASICIQGVPAPYGIHFKASIKYHKTVTYSGYGFPKTHAYLIKVRPAGSLDNWYKIKNIKPNSSGKISGNFTLPTDLRSVSRLQVCLKEVNHGYIVCYTAFNR